MSLKVGSSKGGPKAVATPGIRPSFVLGSRPLDLRAPTPGRIKPLPGQTNYAKIPQGAKANVGFGNTGQTSES